MKRWIVFVLLLGLLVGCATQGTEMKKDVPLTQAVSAEAKKEAVDLALKGEAELKNKNFDQAIKFFEEALKLDPANIIAKNALESAKNQKEAMIRGAAKIAVSSPITPQIVADQNIKTARNLIEAGNIPEGISYLRKAIDTDSSNPRTWFILATQLQKYHKRKGIDEAAQRKELEEAIECYKTVLKLSPQYQNGETHKILGIAYFEIGNYEWAQYYFEQAVKINPQNASYWIEAGNFYKLMGNALNNKGDDYIRQGNQILQKQQPPQASQK